MASSQNIAPDSARDLNDVIGNDSTATFEDDPTFVESNPTGTASSENLGAGDVDESDADDDIADDDELDEEDDEEEDEGEEVDEDDDVDEEDDDADEDDDEDEEDAEGNDAAPALSADGLLQYEDEADDAKEGRSRERGDVARSGQEEALNDGEDDDAGDVSEGVDEDALSAEEDVDLDDEDSALTTEESGAMRHELQTLTALQPPAPGTWMASN